MNAGPAGLRPVAAALRRPHPLRRISSLPNCTQRVSYARKRSAGFLDVDRVDSLTPFPLRQLVTDLTERFQLRFAQQAAVLLVGFSGVQALQSAAGIVLRAVAERDLDAALALLRAAFPAVNSGPVEIVRLEEGTMEPYVRVRVTIPKDNEVAVINQLHQRSGSIDSLADIGEGQKTIAASAPLAAMLGYDKVLARTTRNRATIDYAFADYRPLPVGSPEPPGSPTKGLIR